MDDPSGIQPVNGKGAPNDGIPESLRRDLSRMYLPAEPIEVPREIDQSIAQMAQRRLSERMVASAGQPRGVSAAPDRETPRRLFPMRLVTISAAAAALLLVALVAPRLMSPAVNPGTVAKQTPSTPTALRGDIDADGKVDIVDALILGKLATNDPGVTRRFGAKAGAQGAFDMNADGVVDQQDAISIRTMVVQLEGGAG